MLFDFSNFNTSGVASMNGMFRKCSALKTIYVGNGWNTDSVTTSTNMFTDCTSLVGLSGTVYDSTKKDKTYAHIDTSNAPGYLSAYKTAIIGTVSVTFGGNLGLNYYITLSDDIKNDKNAYAEYTYGGTNKRQKISDTTVDSKGRNVFTCPVYPTQMDETINIRFYTSSGKNCTMLSNRGADLTPSGFDYSVNSYMDAIVKSPTAKETMKALASASIDYGAAVKKYFNNTANVSVSSNVTAVDTSVFNDYKASQTGTKPAGVTGIGMRVVFDADNSLRVYFKYDENIAPKNYTYLLDTKPATLHS